MSYEGSLPTAFLDFNNKITAPATAHHAGNATGASRQTKVTAQPHAERGALDDPKK